MKTSSDISDDLAYRPEGLVVGEAQLRARSGREQRFHRHGFAFADAGLVDARLFSFSRPW